MNSNLKKSDQKSDLNIQKNNGWSKIPSGNITFRSSKNTGPVSVKHPKINFCYAKRIYLQAKRRERRRQRRFI